MSKFNKHIAFFIGYFGGGGIERVTANLAHSFTKLGIKIDLITSPDSPHLWRMPSETNIVDLKSPTLYMCLPALINYLRREQPNFLIAADHYLNEIALIAKLIAGVPTKVIISEHNQLSKTAQNTNKLKEKLAPLSSRLLYPLADGIVAVSQGVAKDLSEIAKLPLTSIQMIYNPVITSEMLTLAKEPIDHPWFTSSEVPVILGVGKLEAQKDFPNLIQAFAKVRKIQPARLVIWEHLN